MCFYCCSINLKRQSEHSGLHLDTSSLVSSFLIAFIKLAFVVFSLMFCKAKIRFCVVFTNYRYLQDLTSSLEMSFHLLV